MTAKQEYFETPGHVIAASSILPLVDILALIIRFYIRRRFKHGLRADDWLIFIATVLTVGMGITLIYGVAHKSIAYRFEIPKGMEHTPFSVATPQAALTGKVQLAVLLMLPLILGLMKASFLTFYMRIFSVDNRGWIHKSLDGMFCFVVLWTMAFFFAQLFGCRLDFYAFWRSTHDLLTKCVQTEKMFLALSISDFITDLILIAIPIPLIWRLNLSRQKKIAIVLIFSLGAVSVAASLTRLVFTADIIRTGFDPSADPIFVITNGLYWGLVECSVAILAADLPTLQSLLRVPAWESFALRSKGIWSVTSAKTQLLKSKASKISLRRERDRPSVEAHCAKNESISIHSASRHGASSEERCIGIELSPLDARNDHQ